MNSLALEAVLMPPIRASIHNPADGTLLAGGTIEFFKPDKVTHKPVFTDPSMSTQYPNPYTLDSIASEPDFYGENDEPYWIVVTPAPAAGCDCSSVAPIYSFFRYLSGNGTNPGPGGEQVFNFISNPQFAHPLDFNFPDDTAGRINDTVTEVAQGWFFETDDPINNDIRVTFTPLFTSNNLGNPKNKLNISVNSLGPTMQKLDITKYLGYVNTLQNENVTLSVFGQGNLATPVNMLVFIEQFYSSGVVVTTQVGTIILPASDDVAVLQFTMPATQGLTLDPINNYTKIILRGPLLQITGYSLTNVMVQTGSVDNPIFIELPPDQYSAETFASDFIWPADNDPVSGYSEFKQMTYIDNQFNWYSRAGQAFMPVNINSVPPDMVLLGNSARQSYFVTDYFGNIPAQRVYDVIGNQWGSAGDLTATSNNNIVTVSSAVGGRQRSVYQDYATAPSGFTFVNTVPGQKAGISLAYSAPGSRTLVATWVDNFAPNQIAGVAGDTFSFPVTPNGVIGNRYRMSNVSAPFMPASSQAILTSTVNPGSPSTPAIANITFVSTSIDDYRYTLGGLLTTRQFYAPQNFLEFPSFGLPNARGRYGGADPGGRYEPYFSPIAVRITVNGVGFDNAITPVAGSQQTITVPFLTNNSIDENIRTFMRTVDNPFTWTVTAPALPPASSAFLYSASAPSGTEYYMWFRINGAGTDPGPIGSRTGVRCDLLSTDTISIAAEKIATLINTQKFSLPQQSDMPGGAPSDPLIKWAIYV